MAETSGTQHVTSAVVGDVGGTRSAAIAGAFVLSGLTSYVTLVVAKQSLTAEDFGVFSIFWSLGFFAAALSASPVEQELSRSAAVQLERGGPLRLELVAACRSVVVASIVVVALSGVLFLSGLISEGASLGVFLAVAVLVVGEAIGAVVRAEASARRDLATLVAAVAGQGVARALAASVVAVVVGGAVPVCLAVGLGAVVPAAFAPRVVRRAGSTSTTVDAHGVPAGGLVAFSTKGARHLAIGSPPRALFAIGTPLLAALIAGADETAQIGDVLAALSLTSAPVLIAGALQAVLIPQFAMWRERDDLHAARKLIVLIVTAVPIGTIVATILAGLVGPTLLDLVFGDTPGVRGGSLAAMTAGAGMLFLANMLTPAIIAWHRYGMLTAAWTVGALTLVVFAFMGGDLADRIGRAFLAGSMVVAVVLVWVAWSSGRTSLHAHQTP